MAKKDVVVRTAQDLERKYNLASLLGLSKNIEISRQGMQRIENELHNFMTATVGNIEDLQEQIDGKVTTWYYTGEPTLESEPASSWDTDELKNEHIGDLYYDKATGHSYIFQYDTEYHWEKMNNADVSEALAIANAAKDTADSKRQVFVVQPTTPYANGDLWISNQEIYICQVSRETGDFNSDDWINNLKYTDDTEAYAVRDELAVLEGTVTVIKTSNDSLNIEFVKQQRTYDTLAGKVVDIEGKLDDMTYNFSTEGLAIGTSTDANNSLLDNTGIKVYNYNKLNAIFNNKGSGIDKLIVTGTAQIGYLRFAKSTKNNKPVTKIFHLKNLVEDLVDLE